VFTARYALSPYIKQIRFVFKGLIGSVEGRSLDLFVRARNRKNNAPRHGTSTVDFVAIVGPSAAGSWGKKKRSRPRLGFFSLSPGTLTPWRTVRLDKLTNSHSVCKKIPAVLRNSKDSEDEP
jgi:hypothetical protein